MGIVRPVPVPGSALSVVASDLAAGVWTLRIDGAPTGLEIDVTFRQQPVDGVTTRRDGNATIVVAGLPAEVLTSGLHSVHAVRRSTGEILASLHVTSGAPIFGDMADELVLLREELDLLKQVLRRHLSEVPAPT